MTDNNSNNGHFDVILAHETQNISSFTNVGLFDVFYSVLIGCF